jgi:hypothetical protein
VLWIANSIGFGRLRRRDCHVAPAKDPPPKEITFDPSTAELINRFFIGYGLVEMAMEDACLCPTRYRAADSWLAQLMELVGLLD